ncbi:MAG: hypothetical protein ABI396_12350 [Ktedonobacteraceae bacterium]
MRESEGGSKSEANNEPMQRMCLPAIRAVNRLECVGETMRHTLNMLAEVAPDWLIEHMQPEWAKRYRSRFSDFREP